MSILIQFGNLRKEFGILRGFWYLVDLTKTVGEKEFGILRGFWYLVDLTKTVGEKQNGDSTYF